MDQTFILVSHDMEFVREVCDRIAWMKGGKVVAMGSTEEVLSAMPPEDQGMKGLAGEPSPAL